jgi:hypothetical protein
MVVGPGRSQALKRRRAEGEKVWPRHINQEDRSSTNSRTWTLHRFGDGGQLYPPPILLQRGPREKYVKLAAAGGIRNSIFEIRLSADSLDGLVLAQLCEGEEEIVSKTVHDRIFF